MRSPWVQTIYALAMILDAERISYTVERLREIRRAKDTATGFHEPDRLWRQGEDALRDLTSPPLEQADRDAMIREARALMERVAGRPLIPEPVS